MIVAKKPKGLFTPSVNASIAACKGHINCTSLIRALPLVAIQLCPRPIPSGNPSTNIDVRCECSSTLSVGKNNEIESGFTGVTKRLIPWFFCSSFLLQKKKDGSTVNPLRCNAITASLDEKISCSSCNCHNFFDGKDKNYNGL